MLRALLFSLFSVVSVLSPPSATAQDSPQAILVLDGSGSMWGQIDGVNKIVIARDVIGELLQTLPENQQLGLMSYGHRRKGDCSDIELLIEPGTDRAAIARAVNAINPKGKTPLSEAVITAAEALRYTEEAATVILVSDGIETCDFDPCDVGRKLEENGINFTAHVIGFDVADPEARAQLQCLAEETGGQFRTASNAAELADALSVVAGPPPAPQPTIRPQPRPVVEIPPEPEPEPEPVTVTFRATDGDGGAVVTGDLVWTIGTDAAGILVEAGTEPSPVLDLMAGSGRATVLRTTDEAMAETTFTIADDATGAVVVTVALPERLPPATLDAPASAPAGSLVEVNWNGPNDDGDYLAATNPDDTRGYFIEYAYLRDGEGTRVKLRMPPNPGTYDLRYILADGKKVLARRSIEVTPLDITLTPPDGAPIGSIADAGWDGPDYKGDYLTIARPDADDDSYQTYEYTREGNPMRIKIPGEPGDYELRYVLGASRVVAARTLFTVTDVATTVSGPETAPMGSTVLVDWRGPDADNDYIAVARPDAEDGEYLGYNYTSTGSPTRLTLPMEAGTFELRYVLAQGRKVIARAPITVTPVTATLASADTVAAGSEVVVDWDGPNYDRDYVTIVALGTDDGDYGTYAYTGTGNPARFNAPIEPGDYELRYVANATKDVVLARRPITVTAVTATLEAPDSAPAGSVLSIAWDGPDNERDYVTIVAPDAADGVYTSYAYTANGNPAEFQAPTEPGDYELRYVANATRDTVLTRRPISITPVAATLNAVSSAAAGSQIAVTWDGPANNRDYISIALPDDKVDRYVSYEYVGREPTLEIQVPSRSGQYELRYVLAGNPARIIARMPLFVDPAQATLDAPATATRGTTVSVVWEGPGNHRDMITLAQPGDKVDGYSDYAYARNGSPAELDVPVEPGTYELRYVLSGPSRLVIERVPLVVE